MKSALKVVSTAPSLALQACGARTLAISACKARYCLLCMAALILVNGGLRADNAASGMPRFLAQTADGEDVRGSLWEVKKDWSIRIGDAKSKFVAGSEVVSIRQTDV